MNDVVVDNEKLVSTTRASEFSGYSKDYVGQLCREDKLICRRISGHWYVSEDSVKAYQNSEAKDDEGVTPEPKKISKENPAYGMKVGNVRDDTFSYDGSEYISTLRGAELTGYAQDYIGQLARNGEIEARKVGRRWFVGRNTLVEHKKHNDGLLAAVQAEASGVESMEGSGVADGKHLEVEAQGVPVEIEIHTDVEPGDINFNVRYTAETDKELVPKMQPKVPVKNTYSPGDIDKVPFGHISGGDPDAEIEVDTQARPMRGNGSASRLGAKTGSVAKEVIFSPTEEKRAMSWWLPVLMILLVLVAGLGAYVYFFGLPAMPETTFSGIFDSLLASDFFTSLSDSYGEILPGSSFEYKAE